MARAGELGRYAAVGEGPGFSRAVARALAELRLARVDATHLREAPAELRALFEASGFHDLSESELRPTFSETRKLVRRAALFRAVAS